jgi:translation elongation factor EF-Tu-like GTPase
MGKSDIEAIITFLGTNEGGRTHFCVSGYRPDHLIKDDYLTTGVHQYKDKIKVLPGESAIGTITFITPEAYPHCLWEGKTMNIQEGSRIVGHAKVTKIYNDLLNIKNIVR